MTLAGHSFADTPQGRKCGCGRLWADIASATNEDLGKTGIAHTGQLNASELQEIEMERARIWYAVQKVAGAL